MKVKSKTGHLYDLEIQHTKPPNWDDIKKHFPVDWDSGVIITYGDKIYCKFDIGVQKEVHESVHIIQQTNDGVEYWWKEYFENPSFRLSQELEAYKEEVKWIKKNFKDRNLRFILIREISNTLSSSMYGNIISFQEAQRLLNS